MRSPRLNGGEHKTATCDDKSQAGGTNPDCPVNTGLESSSEGMRQLHDAGTLT
jgi:hypothetical protein